VSGTELEYSLQFIKGVGPRLAALFAKKGVETVEDALYFIPRAYEDRRHISKISQLYPSQKATALGKVVSAREIGRGRRTQFQAVLSDGGSELLLFWFHSFPSLPQDFIPGHSFLIYGEVSFFEGRPRIVHPEYEKVIEWDNGKPRASHNFGRVIPVYSETEGLHQKTIRKIMAETLRHSIPHLNDPLPESLKQRLGLPGLRESFLTLHFPQDFPENPSDLRPALKRIIFEEFFVLQLGLGLRKKQQLQKKAPVLIDSQGVLKKFIEVLPFTLTEDQKNVLGEVQSDLGKSKAMARLIQGDVGSGKTVVGLGAAVIAASSGYQTALMVPTEILAHQHSQNAQSWLEPLGIRVCLLTGSSSQKTLRKEIASNHYQVIIGTHALFQNDVAFSRLGLVVVDEQHRFGVAQRSELMGKTKQHAPHLLMMTATPIPRSLALTLYGDLDLSLIRQKPAGRKRVKTTVLTDKQRPALYRKIRQTLSTGAQAYIIYPLIEASEKLDLKSATDMHKRLKEVFPEFSIGLLHGRMKAEEKEKILQQFRAGKYQLIISTTVIEVGIDVAAATLMVIEHAERLGLSQLHQLRGRVGRGEAPSECVLVADAFVTQRLRIMERTDDGFEIAEEDLRLRGPGEFLGTRQHGVAGFRLGHILRDADLLTQARKEALSLLEKDPEMKYPEHAAVKAMIETRWKPKLDRLRA